MQEYEWVYQYTNSYEYTNLSKDYKYTNTTGTVGIRIFVILCRIRIIRNIRILVSPFV